jgi:hypothetical protein
VIETRGERGWWGWGRGEEERKNAVYYSFVEVA